MRHCPSPLIALALAVSTWPSFAEPARPLPLPAGTTAVCNDGSYSASVDKRGACRGHRGIKEWLGAAARTAAQADDGPGPIQESKSNDEPDSNKSSADRVWVNENTKVYHCPGDKHYGSTEKGFYLSESDARRKGYHANQSKDCFGSGR